MTETTLESEVEVLALAAAVFPADFRTTLALREGQSGWCWTWTSCKVASGGGWSMAELDVVVVVPTTLSVELSLTIMYPSSVVMTVVILLSSLWLLDLSSDWLLLMMTDDELTVLLLWPLVTSSVALPMTSSSVGSSSSWTGGLGSMTLTIEPTLAGMRTSWSDM